MPVQKRLILESGKRKTAVARARLIDGTGVVRINNIPLELIQPEVARLVMMEPLVTAGKEVRDKVDIAVSVRGGGFMGQADAVKTAIARALVKWSKSPALKKTLRDYDRTMLSGDPRMKEAKKFGGPGARTRRQKSYR